MSQGNHPFISIVVPVYKASAFVDNCLQCIVGQDYEGEVECILIDDCGDDNTLALINEFVDRYEGEIHFRVQSHDKTRGAAAARNTGINLACGEYIFFMDADDAIPSYTLSSLAAPLSFEVFDIVVGRHQETGLMHGYGPSMENGTVLRDGEIIKKYVDGHWSVAVWNKLIKTTFIHENNLFFYEGIIYEDDLWSVQAAVAANSLYVVDKVTYYYNIREGSVMSATLLEKRLLSFRVVFREMNACFVFHNLQNISFCHEKLERFRLTILRSVLLHRELFFKEYLIQREVVHKSWWSCMAMDGWQVYRQTRDFHLALPKKIGAFYLYAWMKLVGLFYPPKEGRPCAY